MRLIYVLGIYSTGNARERPSLRHFSNFGIVIQQSRMVDAMGLVQNSFIRF